MNEQGINIEQLKSKIEQDGNSLSRNSIGNILNGRNSPKVDTLSVITEALGLELYDLFSISGTESDTSINGFIEYKGEVRRIKTKEDLKQLLQSMGETVETLETEEPKPEKNVIENQQLNYSEVPLRSYMPRGITKPTNKKFARRIFRQYNITVCDKKEISEILNGLKRDMKIWVFRSKEDSLKAKTELKRKLNFQFNE